MDINSDCLVCESYLEGIDNIFMHFAKCSGEIRSTSSYYHPILVSANFYETDWTLTCVQK